MGTHNVSGELSGEDYRQFMASLLRDVRALEKMLADGMVETGVRRIGAEQEMFLVDQAWRPAPRSRDVLERLNDESFTTELARFNIEVNLEPIVFGGNCLRDMERQLNDKIRQVRAVADELDLDVVLTGILPTLTPSDLGLDNMTENPRYYALNDALTRLRGRAYEFRIRGTDELLLNFDSVMPEACNTSFQVHFQAGPEEFARLYNTAQAATAPVLAAATNSPLLFGRRLWRETRVALFQQAIDTRSTRHQDRSPRVSFGRKWLQESALEIFQEDISRFRVLFGAKTDEDPFDALREGRAPELSALRLHNSTIYRWNRACYGVSEGVPHLRIENRVLPGGPTPIDEVANAAFWFGLMSGLIGEYDDIAQVMEFDDAATNFVAACRLGLGAHLTWVGGKQLPARSLIRQQLLPLAREGLRSSKVASEDIDRYLGVIEQRVASGRTGSAWMLQSMHGMRGLATRFERLSALTAAAVHRQKEGEPVHTWQPAKLEEAGGWRQHFQRVEQFMTTDVYPVHQDDLVDLVASMMQWQKLRFVLVEDSEHRLVGLISANTLLRLIGQGEAKFKGKATPVHAVMEQEPVTVSPSTSTQDAIELMQQNRIGCLPVVEQDGHVVGLVTERSFMHLSSHLLEHALRK